MNFKSKPEKEKAPTPVTVTPDQKQKALDKLGKHIMHITPKMREKVRIWDIKNK